MDIFDNENFVKHNRPLIPLTIKTNQSFNHDHVQFIPLPDQESPTFPAEITNIADLQPNLPSLASSALPSSPVLNYIQTQPQINTNNITNISLFQPLLGSGSINLSSKNKNNTITQPQRTQIPQHNPQILSNSLKNSAKLETMDITYDIEIFQTPQNKKMTQNIQIEKETPDSISLNKNQKTIKKHKPKHKAQQLDQLLEVEVKPSNQKNDSKPSKSKKSSLARKSDIDDNSEKSKRSSQLKGALDNRNSKESLIDWINRRITGYMLFQNSIDKDMKDIKMDDIDVDHHTKHMNSLVGKKWKSLNPSAREEYKAIAMQNRVDFKKELDCMDNLEDFKLLCSHFIGKVKKVKKNSDD